MKRIKKVLALAIAMALVLGMMSMVSFAADQQGAATADGSIEITGLDDSDSVALYKVIGWEPSVGWQLENGFEVPEFDGKLGTANQAIDIDTGVVNTINSQITSSTPKVEGGTLSDGTYTATVDPGMYIAIVTSGKAGVIYNPIIVSSDYVADGNSVDAPTSEIPASTGGVAVAKKSEITLEKEGTDQTTVDENENETVAVGDVVDFTIDTQIPPFATYNKPIFKITDELSDGITLGSVDDIVVTEPAGAVRDTDYTVTKDSDHKFTIEFSEAYLKTVAANTEVHIEYSATITSDAVQSVNPENNTVTLEYQTNPQSNSEETTGKIRDITNHYSFTIDGNLLGGDGYEATEVVKIGVSADGTEITETIPLSNGNSVGALQGATFKLVYAGTENVVKTKDKDGAEITWDENKIISDASGRITITGLDAGEYELVEVSAPAGYIKMQQAIPVEIVAHVSPVEYVDEEGCTIKTTELTSYEIKINNVETAHYEITNSKDVSQASSNPGDSVVGTDADSGKLKNTKGVELPSTGGIGTTLFYVVGTILVLGAGVLLVTRRRMDTN